MLKKDEELAKRIIKRLGCEKKAQPLRKWPANWRAIWVEAIADEIRRFRSDKRKSDPQTEVIYDAYPRKVGKNHALKAIRDAIKDVGFDKLLEATERYAKCVERWPREYRYSGSSGRDLVPHPSTWYRRGSYHDDPKDWLVHGTHSHSGKRSTGRSAPTGWASVFLGLYGRDNYSLYSGGGVRDSRTGEIINWSDLTNEQKDRVIKYG